MTEDAQVTQMMNEIRRLAPAKQHRLAPDMVNGTKRLTLPAATMILTHLNKCADLRPAGVEAPASRVPQAAERVFGPVAHKSRPASDFPPPMSAFPEIPGGYFATPSATGNNDFDFWYVKRYETGKWAGRVFVKRILGGGRDDQMTTVDLENMPQRLAMKAIREYGWETSQALFAAQLGRCSDCGRWLTDAESRSTGKGPICRNKKR